MNITWILFAKYSYNSKTGKGYVWKIKFFLKGILNVIANRAKGLYPNNEASKAPKLSGVFGGRSRPAQWAKDGNKVL